MVNILLICSAGMTTSMMMKRMQMAAAAKRLNVNIWAVGDAVAKNHIAKADIILLGPQVRYMRQQFQEMAQGKPVMVMDIASYGNLDGAKVLSDTMKRLQGR